jgi:choice-of-anchor C domain-containing protein
MNRSIGRKLSVGMTAVLAFTGSATTIGLAVAPTTATAAPVNLIQNGSFETVAKQTQTFVRVLAGDSTSISNWTVVTPSIYGEGRGSVDVTSNKYWNAEDGNYSLDLAGTSTAPGGIYQDVATTPGVEYSLSFWSAVNGDEKPGIKHTMGVSVNGAALDKVKAVGVGRPLHWVQNTASFTASSTTSRIEFDDTTRKDHHQGPALDNVSLTAVSDVITASPVTIAPQTTGVSFTAPVATFTDSYLTSPTDFAATILWGDGTSSPGTISLSGSTYTVNGTQSYAAHGAYTVEVDISSVAGSTASTSESVEVADAVTGCTGDGCSGNVTTPSETVQVDSTSTTGTILTTVDPAGTGPDCADPFRHAPQVVTVTDTGLNANVVFTVTFNNADADGDWFVPFAVCYQAETPFTDQFGDTVTTGLLPFCGSANPVVAPCVQSIVESPDALGNPDKIGTVVETIVVPPGDPKFH